MQYIFTLKHIYPDKDYSYLIIHINYFPTFIYHNTLKFHYNNNLCLLIIEEYFPPHLRFQQ